MRTAYTAEETQETKSKEDDKSKKTIGNRRASESKKAASNKPNCVCLELDCPLDGQFPRRG